MWFVYLLYSKSKNRHYIGSTNDLESRLTKHNTGKGAKYTRMAKDWKIIYFESFDTKQEALSYEYKVKKNKKCRKDLHKKAYGLPV